MAAKNTKMINDVFGRKAIVTHDPDTFWPLPSELIGVEIEVEDLEQQGSVAPYWTTHQDGSLRNGVEFVLAGPTGGRQLTEAINAFFDAGMRYNISPRTSVHIHINVSDNMTVDQFRNMFTIMYLFEPAVFRWADENRKWCGYCSPLTDLTPQRIINILNDSREEMRFVTAVRGDGNSDRYYGFNVAAYHRHGTVEFRYFPCTTDRAKVIEWIKFCMCVKKAARRHGSPEDILALLQTRDGVQNFLTEWFGDVGSTLIRHLDMDDCLGRVKDMGTMVNVAPESLRNPDGYHRTVRSRGFNRYVTRTFPNAPAAVDSNSAQATSASEYSASLLTARQQTAMRQAARIMETATPPPAIDSLQERRDVLRTQIATAQTRYDRAQAVAVQNPSLYNRQRARARLVELSDLTAQLAQLPR